MYVKYAKKTETLKQHYHVKVDQELRSDCLMWKTFLDQPESVCRPFIDFNTILRADEIDFYTDASGAQELGFGCYFAKQWTNGVWEQGLIDVLKPSIKYLELYAMAVAIELWPFKLRNKPVIIFCDNKSIVGMINKAASPCANYVGTTDILCSTFSFDSVKFFSHLYRTPPTTTHHSPLYHRYELDVRGGVVVGGVCDRYTPPHHHPTPDI